MLRIENGRLVAQEVHAGGRGADYIYVESDEGLVPLSKLFGRYAQLEHVTGRGRRKTYVYRIPLREVEGRALYCFSFTRGGGFLAWRYRVVGGRLVEDAPPPLASLKFALLDKREGEALRKYEEYAVPMVNEARRLIRKTGAEIYASGSRLGELVEDPNAAKTAALAFPTWQGRVKALDALLRAAHELYVTALVADALGAKTRTRHPSSEPAWELEFASDYKPTAVLDSECGTFTIWYQFSFKSWLDVVRDAEPGRVQHVVPDLVVFRGEVWDRVGASLDRVALIVDAKHKELDVADLEQLTSYARTLQQHGLSGRLVVAVLGRAGRGLGLLRSMGVHVVEDVHHSTKGPGSGVARFKGLVRQILCASALSGGTGSVGSAP